MIIAIDIDGTLLPEGGGDVFPNAVSRVNALVDAGHVVVVWTARPWSDYLATKAWLEQSGFRFHELHMGKLCANLYIDDRAISRLEDLPCV